MTFMSSMVEELLGNEDLMMTFLRVTNNTAYLELGQAIIDELPRINSLDIESNAKESTPKKTWSKRKKSPEEEREDEEDL